MSYLVLARKSRPQKFEQVVGQRPVVKTLQNSILRNRVAHAILFSGVRGVGKTTLARIMAKAINCKAELPERPCDECVSCREIATGSSLDLYEIDGASNRGIQEIRELKEKIRFLPTSASFKVIIIDEVHMLTTEAFNALLKTLEEPPAHVYFMFATTEIHKIPITILSRCQQYELKRVSAKELYDHFGKLTLEEGFEIDHNALSLIVREAGGSIRDGLSLLDQMFSFGEKTIHGADVIEMLGLVNREVLMQLTKALLTGDRIHVFTSLEEIFSFGMDTKRFMEDLLNQFRTLLLCKLEGCNDIIDLPEDELLEFQQLSTEHSAETIHLKLNLLMETAESLKFSAQARLLLETSFLKIIEATNVVPLSTLLGQLGEILPQLEKTDALRDQTVPSPPPVSLEKKNTKPIAQETPPSPQPVLEEDNPLSPPNEEPPPPVEPDEMVDDEAQSVEVHPHEKDVRSSWPHFIEYVKDRKLWMAQDLQRAESAKQDGNGELHLTYIDAVNCSLLRQKENHQLLTEYALDFFQKPLKVRFLIPEEDDLVGENGEDSPHKKRQQLVNDPLVIMAAEVFNGQVGDIRIGPRSRK
jgi:DNA polymerase-3 subunit gamma/tau